MMNVNHICLFLIMLAFLSCASIDTGRYYDDNSCCFVSNYPRFKVQIKDKSAKPVETNMKVAHNYAFTTNNGTIVIEIVALPHRNIDYYYPDEAIVKNSGGIPIGAEFFNDKTWVKAVFFPADNWTQTSYFRRQDKFLLGVSYNEFHPEQSSNVENYKKTLILPQSLKDQIDKQFSVANSKFTILE
jgi:hypothetical protein